MYFIYITWEAFHPSFCRVITPKPLSPHFHLRRNSVRPGSHALTAKRLVSDRISHVPSDECDELFELNSELNN